MRSQHKHRKGFVAWMSPFGQWHEDRTIAEAFLEPAIRHFFAERRPS
ncbi:MAG: hypothetical protein AB4426_21815 [Xenococcaceae cyanobacterium]